MPRALRIEFAGACYHIINRGNYRRALFEGKGAAEAFERVLGEAAERFHWDVHAYVIMSTHFHLALELTAADTSAEDLQTIVYEIGKQDEFGFESLRDWFKALYETMLGSAQGPRMGSFIALYGIANTRKLIEEALARG